jgi:hypothetical protein
MRLLAVTVAMALGLPGPGAVASGAGPDTPPAVVLPDAGALFGVHLSLDEHNGLDRRQAMLDFEALVGRRMAIDRQFYVWTDTFPNPDDYWSNSGGRLLYLSWGAGFLDGTCVLWADIAAGLYDGDIEAKAEEMKAFADPLILSFHHEPTTAPPAGESCGTPDEYIAAWRHVRERMEAAGVTNVTYAWTMTALSFKNDNAEPYYPGDDVVDVIAADGYNWFGCPFHPGPWREVDEIFQEFLEFGEARGKPMIMAEYGSGEDPDVEGKKGQWFTNAADTVKRHPLVKGISYFNVGGGVCARYADTSGSSLQRFRANGGDPYFNPPLPLAGVTASDFEFTPRLVTVDQGSGVEWTFEGPSNCTVTDTSGMGLFDSGPMVAGSTYRFFFIAAGGYPYECTGHPEMRGVVTVPIDAVPRSGDVDTKFTIRWAANFPAFGYVYDVQIRRPGSGWVDWMNGQTAGRATFVPDAGPGTYRFRARLRNSANGAASNWSRATSIMVT